MKVNGSVSPETLSFEHRFDGMAEIRFRENIIKTDDGYTYDEYLLVMRDYDGLKENVQKNQQTWLEYAKNQETTKLAEDARTARDKLLVDTNWTQMDDAPLSSEDKESMRKYRQALRDITAQTGFPQEIKWPDEPVVKSTGEHSDRLNFTNEIEELGQTISSLTTSNTTKNKAILASYKQLVSLILEGGITA